MIKLSTAVLRTALVAAGLLTAGVGAASAGEWRVDTNKCPELRQESQQDHRDERVVSCPSRAWFYLRGPNDSRFDQAPSRPHEVVIYTDGRTFYRDGRGAMISLNLHLG